MFLLQAKVVQIKDHTDLIFHDLQILKCDDLVKFKNMASDVQLYRTFNKTLPVNLINIFTVRCL